MIRCLTCGKDWSEKTTGSFEVDSENGLIKCPDCIKFPLEPKSDK